MSFDSSWLWRVFLRQWNGVGWAALLIDARRAERIGVRVGFEVITDSDSPRTSRNGVGR
jgi:hypothetical protein